MKQIIFWFSNHHIKNYWLDYAIEYCKSKFEKAMKYECNIIKYNRIEDWIQIGDLKILFKVAEGPFSYVGWIDTNQYWVEALFNNNFEEFFMTIVKKEIKDGEN